MTVAWLRTMAPVVVVALPLLGVAIAALPLPRRRRAALLIGVMAAALALAVVLTRAVLAGHTAEVNVLHVTPQFWLVLRVDAPGALYGATVAALGLLATAFAVGYLNDDRHPARYHAFAMAVLAATLGLAYAGNLLTFFLFYEAFSVLTYALVVHEQTPEAVAAGVKYIAYVLVGGTLVLAGVLLVYFTVGDASFVPGGFAASGAAVDAASMGALRWAFACLAVGFGVKAALVPLHGWVPDAHPAAPAPFSALLSGVLVAAGGFGILRVIHDVYGVDLVRALGVAPWLAAVAAATVLVGAALAVGQPDLKRRLAYSTISQMGYLTLAVALLGATALVGALVHLTHHAFLKGTLFFCAGAWRHDLGARRISDLRGLGGRTPAVAAAFTVAALGMIGVPPLAGFVSKWWLGAGMLEVGAGWALAVLLLGALLAAAYLLPIVHALYFEDAAPGGSVAAPRADRWTRVPLLTAAVLGVVLGLWATLDGFPLELAARAAAAWFPGG
ncbi:MAG: complex I subunit 5 family protein [Trueperaceae bacterium]